jgi:Holliday junction resolvasome RuvABC endonuclease subunit
MWKIGGRHEPFDVVDWADRWRPDIVVVEKPLSLHGGNLANATVLATVFVAGIVSGMLLEKGYECESVSPQQVRASLIGVAKRGNQDAAIKVVLERLIVGSPKRWNDHMRDAAAAAIVGHRMFQRRAA